MKTRDIPSLEQQILGMLAISQAEKFGNHRLGIGHFHRDGSLLIQIRTQVSPSERIKKHDIYSAKI